jgi:hypothetical protein
MENCSSPTSQFRQIGPKSDILPLTAPAPACYSGGVEELASLFEGTSSMINLRDTMIMTRPCAIVRIREMGVVVPTAGVSSG